jgi:hypothetical protein
MRTLVLLPFALALAAPAQAGVPAVPGPRALGIANALRSAATGDSALSLNPSGMSLVRSYVIEGSYTNDSQGGTAHDVHLSVVDSTSALNLAGGLYYTYVTGPATSGHEAGLALSFPIASRVFIGGLMKYLYLSQEEPLPPGRLKGFTFDAGVTVRPIPALAIAVVAQNLARRESPRTQRTLGGGVSLSPTPDLLLSFDALYDLTSVPNDKVWSFMGGGEYLVGKTLGLRAGGGHRGDTKATYLSAGVSLVSEVGALDAGYQQDLNGSRKETIIGVGARLFIPAP